MNAPTVKAPASAGDAEQLLIRLVKLNAERDVIAGRQTKKIADIFEGDAERVGEIETESVEIRKHIETYALSLLDDKRSFPNGTKTLKFIAGDVSVNAGQPKIVFLDGFGDKSTIQRITDLKLTGLMRNPDPEVDKDAIMTAITEKRLTPEQLVAIGLKKDQDETISIKAVSIEKLKKSSSKSTKNAKS